MDWEARRGLPSDLQAAALLEILEELGPKYVAVAKLWAEYTSAEIGEMLGIPEKHGEVAEEEDKTAACRGTP